MREHKDSLLHKIKRLYTELFLVSLHNRIDSYHTFMHSNKHHTISEQLHKLIDETIDEASHNHSVTELKSKYLNQISEASIQSGQTKIQTHSTNIMAMTLNGLSLFLQKQKAHENDPHMSAKLQQCVWDHIHSAHRYARAGDSYSAKLHANIAVNAIKTLSHYMPENEYNMFYHHLNDELTSTTQEASAIH